MIKRLPLLVLLVLFVRCTNSSAPADVPAAKPTRAAILADFGDGLRRFAAADSSGGSISFAVVHKDTLIFSKAYGYADKEKKIAADSSTIYRIGSITKSFTSFLLMELVEKGVVKLDDPVERYLPEVRHLKGYGDSTRISFLQLATHTAGLVREPGVGAADQGPIADWEQQLLAALSSTGFESTPGTKYSYSNIGYAILGLALSRAAGKPYMDLVQEEIFNPLQMRNSFFVASTAERFAKVAVGRFNGYGGVNLDVPYREHFGRGYKVPNGGIYSTPSDLSKFVMAQLGYSRLLSAGGLASLQAGRVLVGGNSKYGLGLNIDSSANGVMIHHAGSVAGYTAEMRFEKNDGYGVIILCNYNAMGELLGLKAQALLVDLEGY